MKAPILKSTFIAASLCCLLTVGCQAHSQEKEPDSKQVEHKLSQIQDSIDHIKLDLMDMRRNLSAMSDEQAEELMKKLDIGMKRVHEEMDSLNDMMAKGADATLKEVMPLWTSSVNMLARAIENMRNAMTKIEEKSGRAQELLQHAMNNMEHSMRSMENSMKVMQKKLERST